MLHLLHPARQVINAYINSPSENSVLPLPMLDLWPELLPEIPQLAKILSISFSRSLTFLLSLDPISLREGILLGSSQNTKAVKPQLT